MNTVKRSEWTDIMKVKNKLFITSFITSSRIFFKDTSCVQICFAIESKFFIQLVAQVVIHVKGKRKERKKKKTRLKVRATP